MSKITFFIIFLLFLSSSVLSADQYHLKLLAVQESAQGYEGSDADLYLELKPGSGRVFLETFPLTKLDTQISTRFAKQIACAHYDINCDSYDFIYTIKAKSNIIGGPSAGAAIAVLTSIALLDLPYKEDVAITGTINTGGIIGPVGGVKEKIEAAAKAGLPKVLIAQANSLLEVNNSTKEINDSAQNESTENLIEYGKELGLEVVEVIDLDQAVYELTGKQFNNKSVHINENIKYAEIMKGLQQVLCQRSASLQKELKEEDVPLQNDTLSQFQRSQGKADNATLQGDYYSAASFCFGNNILLKRAFYEYKKP